jgi:ribosomal protein S18 acetylase RimI-like enzyme
MITFRTLENVSIENITTVFNESFSDYLIPVSFTTAQLEDKLHNESIRLNLSAGAFLNNQLIGFIIHGCESINGSIILYNAGTGVIPRMRGKQITHSMYQFLFPILKQAQVSKIKLEVITGNSAAIHTYQKSGFQITRKLVCFKGSINNIKPNSTATIKTIENLDWPLIETFHDFEPSWQNAKAAIENQRKNLICLGAYIESNLEAYLIFNPKNNRLLQFAVNRQSRNKGMGQLLFNYIATHYSAAVSIINIDHNAESVLRFLSASGLSPNINQYEMHLSLDDI